MLHEATGQCQDHLCICSANSLSDKHRFGSRNTAVKQTLQFLILWCIYSWWEDTHLIQNINTDIMDPEVLSAVMRCKTGGEREWWRLQTDRQLGQASLRGGLTTPCLFLQVTEVLANATSQYSLGDAAKPWLPSSSWCFLPGGGALSSRSGQRVSGSQGAEGARREELRVRGESGEPLCSDLGGRRWQ